MLIKKDQKKGFTLIELLVSVTLFSVVLTVMMGTIVTIADSNKKARSLMSVMNNLNFSVDSMTRSLKTGKNPSTSGSGCITTTQIDYSNSVTDTTELVTYCFVETNGIGRIVKTVGGGAPFPLTSPDVDIDYLTFEVIKFSGSDQPRIAISLEGTVRVSPKISSNFTIQTTVAQRQLNI